MTAKETADEKAIGATIQFGYDLQANEEEPNEEEPNDDRIEERIDEARFAELSAWRSILYAQDLTGQHPDYNNGFSFGNLSCRTSTDADSFVITGSQTASAKRFTQDNLVRITNANLERFWVDAEGAVPPSVDTMTHAAIYAADTRIEFIFHVHSAEIWNLQTPLNLPTITAQPGSKESALAALELMATNQSRPLVFIEQEGVNSIYAIGHHARDCGGLIISYLAKARALALQANS